MNLIGDILALLILGVLVGGVFLGTKLVKFFNKNGAGTTLTREKILPIVLITPAFFIFVNWLVIPILSFLTEYGNESTQEYWAWTFLGWAKRAFGSCSISSLTGVWPTADFGMMKESTKHLHFALISFWWVWQDLLTMSIFSWRKKLLHERTGIEFEEPETYELAILGVLRFVFGILIAWVVWLILDLAEPTGIIAPWYAIPETLISVGGNDGVTFWEGNLTLIVDKPLHIIWIAFILIWFGFPSVVNHRLFKGFLNLVDFHPWTKNFSQSIAGNFFKKNYLHELIPDSCSASWETVRSVLLLAVFLETVPGFIAWIMQCQFKAPVPFFAGMFDFGWTTMTAGFNTLSTSELYIPSLGIVWLLMITGTEPGGTGGRTTGRLILPFLLEKITKIRVLTDRARKFFWWRLVGVSIFVGAMFMGLVVFNDFSKINFWQLLFLLPSLHSNVGLDTGASMALGTIQCWFASLTCSAGYWAVTGWASLTWFHQKDILGFEDDFVFEWNIFGKNFRFRFGSERVG